MSDSDAYNDGYTHEVLHTAHVLMDTWDQHVIDTRCADEFPDVKRAGEAVAKAMYDFYQLVGEKFVDDVTTLHT
jgi:hypothetical protein